jgi:peptide/nickel transport system substrate-binding protein
VIYRHVKEAATQRLLLEKGDVDIARNLSPQDLAHWPVKDIKTTATPKGTVYYFSLNQKNPNLAKPEVREAFKWLVDYAAIGDTIMKNIGVVHQNFLPMGLLGASTVNPYKLDVDKAKALLAKAGLPERLQGHDGYAHRAAGARHGRGLAANRQARRHRARNHPRRRQADADQVPRPHPRHVHRQWGADYWDPHTNADTFVRNPDNADDAKSKPLAWRNAWAIPELTKKADAAVLERDPAKRKRHVRGDAGRIPQDQPLCDAVPADRGGGLPQQRGRPAHRLDVGLHLRLSRHQTLMR